MTLKMISWSVYLSKLVSHRVHHLWSVLGIDPQVCHQIYIANLRKLYLLDDFNCNLLPEANAYNSSYLTKIFDIYSLSQLITEPTRVTLASKTLIDLCITNSQENVTNSGVIHLGISDHSLVFA